MSLASVLHTSLSGMYAATVSVEAVSHNLANSQTDGYKSIRPTFGEQPSLGGVRVTGFVTDYSPGPLVVEGDETVEQSNVDVGAELVELIMAEDQFQANAVVFDTAGDMLDALMGLGRR